MENGKNTKEIFTNAVRLYYKPLLLYVRGLVRGDAAAQDVVQEALISAYLAWDGYMEQGRVFAWLRVIARNAAYRYLRQERRFVYVGGAEGFDILSNQPDPAEHTEDVLVAGEGYERILTAINNLPDTQRQVMHYRFVQGLSVEETAAQTGFPAGSVKSRTHYGMKKVKAELKDYFIEGAIIMECRKAYEYLYLHAKGTIQPADKEAVDKHISACTHCAGIAGSLKTLVPYIKDAPLDRMRHYSISFPVGDGLVLGYFGMNSHIENFAELNKTLDARGGVIPDSEIWFRSGFNANTNHLAEFDNEGNRVEVKISEGENSNFSSIRYTKMKRVYEYHQTNTVHLSPDTFKQYVKSPDAPNLYIVKTQNNFGQQVKSGLYLAIPGKAVNVRVRQGADVIDCGEYKFVYDDRYVAESQTIFLECTYNL
jgi:RNA polymerase sigma-70 factor (ECF subfamily)